MSLQLIEKLYEDNKDLSNFLFEKHEISFQSQLDDNFKKVLLVAAGSNLEHQITDILTEFTKKASNDCRSLISFVQNKAISHQYHTYFGWRDNTANPFFGLFGEDLKGEIISDRSSDRDLDNGIDAFMEIGILRNKLVHEDFVSFILDKTAAEVFELYILSLKFISYLSDKLSKSIQ